LGKRQASGIGEGLRPLCGLPSSILTQQPRPYGFGAWGVYADQVAAVLAHGTLSNVR
jgi:hypothetical protein